MRQSFANCARGGIVNENDALEALENGHLSSVALDVFEVEPISKDNKLVQHPNFHGTPHIGAATLEAQDRVGTDIKAVMMVLEGRIALPQSINHISSNTNFMFANWWCEIQSTF